MSTLINIIIPLAIAAASYMFIYFLTKKGLFVSDTIIKARIIIGSIGVGYFLSTAVIHNNSKEIISTGLFAVLIIYGVISLQNKYLRLKD